MAEIVLGVCGGIAAYKSAELLRLFTESGHSVQVVPTGSALRFVGAATFEALSGKPVSHDLFDRVDEVAHVKVGQNADLVVIAPATADLMAKSAAGMADNLLLATLLTARCPVVMAPAMHTEMWEHPATAANVALLRERGVRVIEPAVGRLTGKDSGKGRLPDPADIFAFAQQTLSGVEADLSGRSVVVSAGGTREYLDPVRYLGNRSSGRQGYALATAAAARGADVVLIAANTALADPPGVTVVPVSSTDELAQAVTRYSVDADAVVMAAAPADFRPATFTDAKIKKTADHRVPDISLVENPDILASLVRARTGGTPVIVGFAAETGDDSNSVIDYARAKLTRKGCDLLVVNDVSDGKVFGAETTEAIILDSDGSTLDIGPVPKLDLAHAIWDTVKKRLSQSADS